ncbi:DJ-1/PfpI family protein [Nocardioides zhouii]|uniref:DJ-1/PfpI family protein n=1 Tax=Nocardioides zhouii TaxID=1168729 RepID=A0A4V1RPJ7_9ACTN|nr:DJ-1/PfpI family protein [Nocardioides zhouii]RYC09597.1 DJ-1/PfpI family protein [Nocardioides zhouii]
MPEHPVPSTPPTEGPSTSVTAQAGTQASHASETAPTRRRQIGLLVFDGVEELDAVGPWEVLSNWTRQHPEDGWDVFCMSVHGGPVVGAKSLMLGAHHSTQSTPQLDVLIHPGGPGTRPMLNDPEHLQWVRDARRDVPLMASVCTGSLVYAAAGLLTGRRATTHWASLNHLAELDPTVITDVRSRFVDDGDLITSAGVSAGIDMALHLVARLASTDRAQEVRRDIQYDPMPTV